MPDAALGRQRAQHSQRWRHWLRWAVRALAGVAVLAVASVAALLLLARGGVEPFVWSPAATPAIGDTVPGEFEVAAGPSPAAVDTPVHIRVRGLPPGADVLALASTEDARDVAFESWARFRADAGGDLDLDTTAPKEGTYHGVDGNGLLWSMRAADGTPFATASNWAEREYRIRIVSDGRERQARLRRDYPGDDVEARPVGGARWSGLLTTPRQGGPFPPVVLLGGWGDGPLPLTSALIARRGFVVLNVGYYLWKGLPPELVEIPIESVTEAIDWLQSRPEVRAGGVGLYGISRGAELALLAASRDSRIGAVAAWLPASRAFAGISLTSLRQRSAWTWRGRPIAFARSPLTRATAGVAARFLLRRPTAFRPTYAAALAAGDEASVIRVEKIGGEVLVVAGGQDQLWPSAEMAERIARRIGSDRCTKMIFPEAGHGLRYVLWPGGDFTERFLIRGGTPEANHLAGRAAWIATLELFERRLR